MTKPLRLRLNDGRHIPAIGLGIWQVPAMGTAATVSSALQMGYRLVDGAAIYGNEEGLGQGLRASGLPRDEVFVTTKIWNSAQGYDSTLTALDESLARLAMDRVDLCLIHWPCPARGRFIDTWRALIRARDDGRAASIGVSNFLPEHLERLVDATGVVPALNQIELNPRLQQAELRALHDRMGIVTQSWTPLGQGASFDAAPVRDAARRSGRTPAQVILRWHVQLGCSVLPRSVRPARQAENLALCGFTLTDAEMTAIATLDEGVRCGPDPAVFQ